ncbi:MAG TPA: amino acid permease, partial [Myxococcota bacterium]|nr:amino acid permease [Myxococcota bacterium]
LAAVLPRRKTPWLATLAVAAVSGALLPFGAVDVVASLSSFASLLAFAAVNAALIALRRREPKRERPFRVPGALAGVPLLPALGAIATLAIATQLDRTALVAGGGATLAFAAYAAWRRRA